jgi:hypothetical protein
MSETADSGVEGSHAEASGLDGNELPGLGSLPVTSGGDRAIPQGSCQPRYLAFVPRPLPRGRY